MDRMRLRAASQLARLPVMTIVSELLFSAGRSILVLLSSRIYEDRGGHERLAGRRDAWSPGLGGQATPRHLQPEWHRAAGGRARGAKVTFLMFAPPLPMMFL